MSRYLEYFPGAFDASVTEKMKPENKPYVAYSETEGMVYTVIPNYLTFTALEDNCSIGFYNNPDSSINPTIEYSFDKNTWSTLTTNVSIEKGSKMYCRGLNPNGISDVGNDYGYNYFIGEGKFNISGDIMSIIDYETMPETMIGAFYNLFGGDIGISRDNFVDIVDASNLILSATTLVEWCYGEMFYGCTSLIATPELPATMLAPSCYSCMFEGCTSLKTAPELPATELAESCYFSIFGRCRSLTAAPVLPATTLAESCYSYMFRDCTSLTTTPVLPATTLAKSCYNGMFYGCTSLISTPVLPATTLTNICYGSMFEGCTSLTSAPELPATTLAESCYSAMFRNCTSLTTAPIILSATTLAPNCYKNMFYECTSLTSAPELPATTLTWGCYESMFRGCTSLTTAPELPATTLNGHCYYEMFWSCNKLDYIKCLATDISVTDCTKDWVNGVSSTGTFVKHPSMSDWTTDSWSGIPSGWIVVDANI